MESKKECYVCRLLDPEILAPTFRDNCAKRADGACCSDCTLYPNLCLHYCLYVQLGKQGECGWQLTKEEAFWRKVFEERITGPRARERS